MTTAAKAESGQRVPGLALAAVVTVDKPRVVAPAAAREIDVYTRSARAEGLRVASDVASYASYIIPISSGVVASMTGLDTLMMYGIGFAVGFGCLQAKGVLARMSNEVRAS